MNKKTAFLLINSSLSPSAVSELNNFFKFVGESMAELDADIMTELRHYDPEALDELREMIDQRLTPYLRKNIERGLNEGFYRNNLDSEQYASTYLYVLGTVLEGGRDWNETKRTITHINDIFMHGVLNAKGMRI
ncbi:MAG: hypothetical protein WEB30_17675 [Cyclobacteriaceae bacterium]